jgi:hypothetical protein
MPSFHFHFCDDAKDTIIATTFFPEGFKEPWTMPGAGNMPLNIVQTLLTTCFIDQNKMGEGADESEQDNQKLDEATQKKLDVLTAKMEANKANLEKLDQKASAGKNLSKDDLAKISESIEEGRKIQESIQDALPHAPGKYFFEVSHNNGSSLMVDEKIDGKKLSPSNTAIVYAWFKIQIKQEPKK